MASSQMKTYLFIGFGTVLVVIGALMVVFWPPLFFAQLKNMMILTETSQSFEIWRETPIPMYLECYMFNITNVEDILAHRNVSIKVEQLGPYVFRENHIKTNLTWNNNNDTLTYYNQRTWFFEPSMSNGSLSDNITSINPVIATVAYTMRRYNPLITVPVDVFLRMYHDNLFMTANATSWLFDGIDDPILDIAAQFPDLPINIPYDKFGWFYTRNGSAEYDGSFTINTGATEFSNLGNVEAWRYSNRTDYRGECGVVKGSSGELWAPEFGQPEVQVFASDLCTYITLQKSKDVRIENIDGVEYAADESVFDNGYRYPSMACYCDEVRDEDCLPSGALNVSDCRFGAPAFVSLPHFLHSDPYYPSKIDGMVPKEDYNFRLALEMFTGMPLAVAAQLQINMLVRHVRGISINNVLPDPDTLVPMFWFKQEVRVTPEYARMARLALNVRYYVPYAFYGLSIIGVLLLIPGITILLRKIFKSPETEPIISNQEVTNES